MIAVIQRVSRATVSVEGSLTAGTGKGFLVLLGVEETDTVEDAEILAQKIAGLRVFEDGSGKMNLDIKDARGEVLSIPQFTLVAEMKKGNRPSFNRAAKPGPASSLWKRFGKALRARNVPVREGQFGAKMEVSLINDGPVTLYMDTLQWRNKNE